MLGFERTGSISREVESSIAAAVDRETLMTYVSSGPASGAGRLGTISLLFAGQKLSNGLDAKAVQLGAKQIADSTKNLPVQTSLNDIAMEVGTALLAQSPESAVAWALTESTVGKQPVLKEAAERVLFEAARDCPENIVAGISDKKYKGNRSHALTGVLATVADNWGGAKAMGMLDSSSDVERKTAVPAVLSSWANRDPGSALEWVMEHSQSIESLDVKGSFLPFIEENPFAASAYAARLKEGSLRNEFVTALAVRIGVEDPESAIAWINSLNEEARTRAVAKMETVLPAADLQRINDGLVKSKP
jgi:hypothetical protein